MSEYTKWPMYNVVQLLENPVYATPFATKLTWAVDVQLLYMVSSQLLMFKNIYSPGCVAPLVGA